MFYVDLSTVHRIWKENQLSVKIDKAIKSENRSKNVNSYQESILCDIVKDDCSLSQENLSDGFFKAIYIQISERTLSRYLINEFIPEGRIIASKILERHD
ncbi:hypothetical protein RF11_01335 [Thelohanellus kitauei]|uniref:Uncharacterized protein n=1 Tax=Thelohanellus kitauei TaxID=669202 RepID=A0A0C2N101_THEKT|nr:hypothetical protein RF11_01335 [Thelohanellus kitauei]